MASTAAERTLRTQIGRFTSAADIGYAAAPIAAHSGAVIEAGPLAS